MENQIVLTPFQQRVACLICEDKETKEIAEITRKTSRTIEGVRAKIKELLGVKTLGGLVYALVKKELVPLFPNKNPS